MQRVGVALYLLYVEHLLGGGILDDRGQRLRLLDVDVGNLVVLLHIEDRRHASQRIVAHKLVLLEEAHHLGAADLVEVEGILHRSDAGVGEHTAAVHLPVLEEQVHRFGSELVADLVPEYRAAEEHRYRVELGEFEGVAAELHVAAVNLGVAPRAEPLDEGGIRLPGEGKAVRGGLRSQAVQRILYGCVVSRS